jgi:hypothetical protein
MGAADGARDRKARRIRKHLIVLVSGSEDAQETSYQLEKSRMVQGQRRLRNPRLEYWQNRILPHNGRQKRTPRTAGRRPQNRSPGRPQRSWHFADLLSAPG